MDEWTYKWTNKGVLWMNEYINGQIRVYYGWMNV